MEQAHGHIAERSFLEMTRHVGGGLHVERLGFLDQRVHDVDLAPRGDLIAKEFLDLGTLRVGPRDGDDGPASGRQLVEDGDVEIAVEREGKRARNRRRRHDEQVGTLGLAAQARALLDAEAVLLVDDGEPEILERHAFLHERVGADRARDGPVGERRPARGALARLERGGERASTSRPSGSSRRRNVPKCCSARISVGAITAAW